MDEADHAHPEEHFLFTSESVGEGHPGIVRIVMLVEVDKVMRN